MSFIHNDKDMRVEVILCLDEDKQPCKAWVDMEQEVYEKFVQETNV
jgi:hypothetical protein